MRGFFVPAIECGSRDDREVPAEGNRAALAARLGGRGCVPHAQSRARPGRGRQDLRRRDAAVPLGRAAHGARPELHDRRRRRPPAPPARLPRPASDGLRRLRPARRERGDPRRHASTRLHGAQHRRDPGADAPHGLGDGLGARDLDARARVLPLDAMALPPLLRAGPRVSQGGTGQLVPGRPDGARERAGDRRPLRALRRRGRGQDPDPVVLQDHRLRRRAARRDGPARAVAGARPDDAAQLDRPLRRRARDLPCRRLR